MTKQRISQIQANLEKGEAALITSGSNRFYLTSFSTSAGFVLITGDKAFFFTDSRYFEKAQQVVSSCRVVLLKRMLEQLKSVLDEEKIKKLYIEANETSISELRRYENALNDIDIQKDNRLDALLSQLRAVKDESELDCIRRAQRITDDAFSYILTRISTEKTEREIALELEFYMRSNGSEGVAFDTIAVSGKNSSLPHGVPGDKRIENGDFLTMDFGAVIGGYRSDMTRTVAIGYVSDEQKRVYETVLSAQKAGINAMKAGVRGCDADRAARAVIEDAGYGEFFGHSLGHSVGIDIHESPNSSPVCETAFKAGTVITVEPGIYLPAKFGVRIEDLVCITEKGCKNLTKSPKELIVI